MIDLNALDSPDSLAVAFMLALVLFTWRAMRPRVPREREAVDMRRAIEGICRTIDDSLAFRPLPMGTSTFRRTMQVVADARGAQAVARMMLDESPRAMPDDEKSRAAFWRCKRACDRLLDHIERTRGGVS